MVTCQGIWKRTSRSSTPTDGVEERGRGMGGEVRDGANYRGQSGEQQPLGLLAPESPCYLGVSAF